MWPSSFNPSYLYNLLSVSRSFFTPSQSTLPMPRSAEQRSPRAAKESERRAVEAPASRQARLDTVRAATRDRRAAQTLRLVRVGWLPTRLQLGDAVRRKPWSPAAKRRNSRMRAELRRQAADIAAARCARRDATRGRFLSRFRLSFGWLQCATVRV